MTLGISVSVIVSLVRAFSMQSAPWHEEKVVRFSDRYPQVYEGLLARDSALEASHSLEFEVAFRSDRYQGEARLDELIEHARVLWKGKEGEYLQTVEWEESPIRRGPYFERIAFSHLAGGSVITGNPSLPTAYSFGFRRSQVTSRTDKLSPHFFGGWVRGHSPSELLGKMQVIAVPSDERVDPDVLRIIVGPILPSDLIQAPKCILYDVTISIRDDYLITHLAKFVNSSVIGEAFPAQLSISHWGTTFWMYEEWDCVGTAFVLGLKIPKKVVHQVRYIDPDNKNFRGFGFNTSELLASGVPDQSFDASQFRQSVPLASSIRDLDLNVSIPLGVVSPQRALGITRNQLARYKWLLRHTDQPASNPPLTYSFSEAYEDLQRPLSANCAVIAAYLFALAIGLDTPFEFFQERVPIDLQGASSFGEIAATFDSLEIPYTVTRRTGEAIARLTEPALCFAKGSAGSPVGHFFVVAPVHGKASIIEPPFEPFGIRQATITPDEEFVVLAMRTDSTVSPVVLAVLAGLIGLTALVAFRGRRKAVALGGLVILFAIPMSCTRKPAASQDFVSSSVVKVLPESVIERRNLRFGAVETIEAQLQNVGVAVVSIERVDSSCGCLSAIINPMSLLPGETAALTIQASTVSPLSAVDVAIYGRVGDGINQPLAGVKVILHSIGQIGRFDARELIFNRVGQEQTIGFSWVSTELPPPDELDLILPSGIKQVGITATDAYQKLGIWYRYYKVKVMSIEALHEVGIVQVVHDGLFLEGQLRLLQREPTIQKTRVLLGGLPSFKETRIQRPPELTNVIVGSYFGEHIKLRFADGIAYVTLINPPRDQVSFSDEVLVRYQGSREVEWWLSGAVEQ